MASLEEQSVNCPYCGENITVLVDTSVPEQHYIEDCEVCCSPISFHVLVDGDGGVEVRVAHENEGFV